MLTAHTVTAVITDTAEELKKADVICSLMLAENQMNFFLTLV